MIPGRRKVHTISHTWLLVLLSPSKTVSPIYQVSSASQKLDRVGYDKITDNNQQTKQSCKYLNMK